jgi:hypothetical protein
MTIAITQPTPGYIGAGMYLFGTTTVALVNPPCEIYAEVADFSLGLQTTNGHAYCYASPWSLLLGWDDVSPSFQFPQTGAAAGHAVSVAIQIFDSLGALLDSAIISGYFHDPATGIPGLLAKQFNLLGNLPILDAIYAAVHRDL